MNELLQRVIDAHGGWERWQELSKVSARARLGGTVWTLKGQAGAPTDLRITASLHAQHVELVPSAAGGARAIYEPGRTRIEADDGRILDARERPRASFARHALTTPWDDLQLVYFRGYASWTYFTSPFLFREPGFQVREIEPWREGDETWRRLHVTFPPEVHSHSTEQVFYFDAERLLRRHDYSVDIMGGTSSAHYAADHVTVGGIVFPTRRRVYARDAENRPLLDRVAVAIDFDDITVE